MLVLGVGLLILLAVLYAHISNNVEKYASAGNVLPRVIILGCGLSFGAASALFFFDSVAETSNHLRIGLLISPMLAVAALVYCVVALFMPNNLVRGLLHYSFRHKLTDDV